MSGDENKLKSRISGGAGGKAVSRPFIKDGSKNAERQAVSGKDADEGASGSRAFTGKAESSEKKSEVRKKERREKARSANKNKPSKAGKAKSAKAKKRNTDASGASQKEQSENSSGKLKSAIIAVLLILLTGAACLGIYHVSLVKHIEVLGCSTYSPTDIINAADLYTGKCILTYDTKAIKKSLDGDPYLKILSVERVYPDLIRITVEERTEYAAISAGTGTYCIIDRDGCVLYTGRRDNTEGLITVNGLSTFGFSTGTYISSDKSILRPYVLMELFAAFGERDGEIASIDISIPASLKIATTDGYTVMLGDSVEIEHKVARMFEALDRVRAEGKQNSVIYINTDSTDIGQGGSPTATAAPATTEAPADNPEDYSGERTEEPTEDPVGQPENTDPGGES